MRGAGTTLPRFSVVIPCYNRATYLSESIASVRTQTGNFEIGEIIIVDDGSIDADAIATMDELARSPGVRLIRTANGGPANARNLGVEAAQSEWIAFLDDDDVWPAGTFRAVVDAMTEFPDAQWFGGDFKKFRTGEPPQRQSHYRTAIRALRYLAPAFESGRPLRLARPKQAFLDVYMSITSATVVSKRIFQAVGGFNSKYVPEEDLDFFIRLAAATDFVFVPGRTVLYRQHAASISGGETRAPNNASIPIFRDLLHHPEFQGERRQIRHRMAEIHLMHAVHYRTRRCFLRAGKSAIASAMADPVQAPAALRQLVAAILRRD